MITYRSLSGSRVWIVGRFEVYLVRELHRRNIKMLRLRFGRRYLEVRW